MAAVVYGRHAACSADRRVRRAGVSPSTIIDEIDERHRTSICRAFGVEISSKHDTSNAVQCVVSGRSIRQDQQLSNMSPVAVPARMRSHIKVGNQPTVPVDVLQCRHLTLISYALQRQQISLEGRPLVDYPRKVRGNDFFCKTRSNILPCTVFKSTEKVRKKRSLCPASPCIWMRQTSTATCCSVSARSSHAV